MVRGTLFQDSYSPQFSGHETFPLRYGWLKKAYDRVAKTEHEANNRASCWDDDAIARFGVGKNMVGSMRHWAKAAKIIVEPETKTVRTTELGRRLFGDAGLDPYMEHPATLWLIHWQLAARPEKTTWFWAFSHYPAITFERDGLLKKPQPACQGPEIGRGSPQRRSRTTSHALSGPTSPGSLRVEPGMMMHLSRRSPSWV